jgi:high-affinity K+ transport system ATPase subunit B
MPSEKNANMQRAADLVRDAATNEAAEILQRLNSSPTGLSEDEAAERLEVFGPNEVAQEKQHGWLLRLWVAVRNPLVILLAVIATITFATASEASDYIGASVMVGMIVMAVLLRLIQETKADSAAAKLKAMIKVTATALRDGQPKEIPLKDLVPGDVVKLSAGDMIPGDVRLISAKDLFVIQGTLTGESLPVEKTDVRDTRQNISIIEHTNLCFLGTSVESGAATAVIVATGVQTYFGKMASSLAAQQPDTAFDRGVKRFVWLMIGFMAVMSPMVFFINGFTKHSWGKETFLFALAIAVGLTPEMLPMIVSVCLSKGALAMSKKKVIVKKLNSIQNFGAMNVLCTDKTGTLTIDHVILEIHCDVFKNESEEVLRDAYLISHFQTGLKNVLDRAVLKYSELHRELGVENITKVDEIPFDFSRRMMSVVVEGADGQCQLLTKGAPESVFKKCTHFESAGEIFEMEPILVGNLIEQVNSLSEDGFRVLAIASKKMEKRGVCSKADEENLVLTGYLAFLDPPKDSAKTAIAALRQHGVTVKVLTGDNDLVTRKVCTEVGINAEKIILGNDVEKMTDAQLADVIDCTDVYARLSPAHKKARGAGAPEKGPRRRFHGRRHQRRARPARGGRGHLRGHGGGHRQGIRRHDPAGKKPDGARGGRARRPQGFREHHEIHPHGREFQFRQHVQHARRERVVSVPADPDHPAAHEQPALRFFTGADPDGQRDRAIHRQAAPVADGRNRQVHHLHRSHQLHFRLHDFLCHVVLFQVQPRRASAAAGACRAVRPRRRSRPHLRRRPVQHRLVRRIADDADPHHPRHPHESDPVRAVARELAAHHDHDSHHGHRRVSAVFAHCERTAFRPAALAVLADSARDIVLLPRPDAAHQDMARPKRMDLNLWKQKAVPHSTERLS